MTTKTKMLSERYKIIEQIGIGGMSYVYKARDTKKRKDVAIKVLKEELVHDEDLLKRFKDEASASKKIKHVNVVSVYDMVDEGDLHYIVMEYLDGVTLSKYIQMKKRLTNEETVKISLDIAKGLEAAHKVGIVHRDIKPQNVVIMKDGTAKITDFGIARAISSTTQNVSVVGTVHYISPEQANNTVVDFRSDIYSLGCAMYEMITGIVPFDGDNPVNIIVSHLKNSIKKPSLDNEEIYTSLEKVIMKCTRMIPRERYQTATELVKDLSKVLEDKNGTFIKENVYDDTEGKTVIISNDQMKLIKALSSKYTNANTNQNINISKEQKEFNDKYLNKNIFESKLFRNLTYLLIFVLIAVIIGGILLFNNMNKIEEQEEEIATKSETTKIIQRSLIGLDVEVANILLTDYNMQAEIVGEEYNDEYEKGKIISVDQGVVDGIPYTKVILSKGSFVLDFSDVNKLNETRFSDMVSMLEEREIRYSTVEIYDARVEKGHIVGCNKNNSAEKGDLIFTISKGLSEDMRIMPDLTNKTLEEAKNLLEDNNLVIGNIGHIADTLIPENHIVNQSVTKGTEVERGSIIDITLSSGFFGEYIAPSNGNKYVGKLSTNYTVSRGRGTPIIENKEQYLILYVRLKQNTSKGIIYKELMQPSKYKVGTSLSLVFDNIDGENGIKGGEVQVVDCMNDEVLAYYNIFFKEV